MKMNSGERNELLIKLYLVSMRDNGSKFSGMPIRNVSFANLELIQINNALYSSGH